MSQAALTHCNADANGTRIHYVRAGSGPPAPGALLAHLLPFLNGEPDGREQDTPRHSPGGVP